MKPSTERKEAIVEGRSEETENDKHEKRVGHRWSRIGREDRAESSKLGLELMELPFLQQYIHK